MRHIYSNCNVKNKLWSEISYIKFLSTLLDRPLYCFSFVYQVNIETCKTTALVILRDAVLPFQNYEAQDQLQLDQNAIPSVVLLCQHAEGK